MRMKRVCICDGDPITNIPKSLCRYCDSTKPGKPTRKGWLVAANVRTDGESVSTVNDICAFWNAFNPRWREEFGFMHFHGVDLLVSFCLHSLSIYQLCLTSLSYIN